MRNRLKSKSQLLFVTLAVCLLSASCIKDYIGGPKAYKEDKKELKDVLQDFAFTEEEKDAEGHAALYLSPFSTTNFVQKNFGSPFAVSLTLDQWIGFFTSWDYEYFPVYSDIKFMIKSGMAIDSHQFQGFRDGEPDLFGHDFFVYIDTPDGWKIVSLTSTVTQPDDTTDYNSVEPVSGNPEAVFGNFEDSFGAVDGDTFQSLFISGTAPCIRFKKSFTAAYSDEVDSATGFFAQLPGANSGLEMDFDHIDVRIKDGYVAVASATYTMRDNGKLVEKGRMMATLAGTPPEGWRITAALFSVYKTKIGL
ncbi:MAG: hypothetical protein WA913_16290 [Pricia sp.]